MITDPFLPPAPAPSPIRVDWGPDDFARVLDAVKAEGDAEGYHRGRAELRHEIAVEIERELVCCDAYQRDQGTARAGETHAICFWGGAAAAIARDDRSGATGGPVAAEVKERATLVPAITSRGIVTHLRALEAPGWTLCGCDALEPPSDWPDDARPCSRCVQCKARMAKVGYEVVDGS